MFLRKRLQRVKFKYADVNVYVSSDLGFNLGAAAISHVTFLLFLEFLESHVP